MERAILRAVGQLLWLPVVIFFSACSLERPAGRSRVDIVVPNLSGVGGATLLSRAEARSSLRINRHTLSAEDSSSQYSSWPGGAFLPLLTPTSVSDFDCIGVHVSGPEIEKDYADLKEPSHCGAASLSSMHSPGKILGLVPVTGGTVELDVPVGAEVVVQLFGVVTSDGTCPSVSSVMSDIRTFTAASHGDAAAMEQVSSGEVLLIDQPLELASTSLTVSQDSELRLRPALNAGELKPLFCDGTTSLSPVLEISAVVVGNTVLDLEGGAVSAANASASDPIEVFAVLDFYQHITGFDRLNEISLVGAEFQTEPEEISPGIYTLDLLVTDPENFSLAVPAGVAQDLYGRSNAAATGDPATQLRQALLLAGYGQSSGSGSSPSISPLTLAVTPADGNSMVQVKNNDGDPAFDVIASTLQPIRVRLSFSKPLLTTPANLMVNCSHCNWSTALTSVASSGGTEYLMDIEPTGFTQSGLVELSIGAGTAITADGSENYPSASTMALYAVNSTNATASATINAPSVITSGTVVSASGTCTAYGMSYQVDLLLGGVAIDSDYFLCDWSGQWAIDLSFAGQTLHSSGDSYSIAVFPPLDFSSFGSAINSSSSTIDLTAPAITAISPAGGQILTASSPNVTISCSEDGTLYWAVAGGSSGSLGCNAGVGVVDLYSATSDGPVQFSVYERDASGNQSATTTRVYYRGSLSVGSPYSANSGSQGWNFYVRTADTATLCNGDPAYETNATACIHAGASRKLSTSFTSCNELSGITDALGVFDWSCSLSAGYAVLLGTLKSDKSLADLIKSTSDGWLLNSVSFTYTSASGNQSFSTDSAAWWSNTVAPLSGRTSLVIEGEVVVVPATVSTTGLTISADRVSLLVVSGATLGWAAASATNCDSSGGSSNTLRCLIQSANKKFLWFEGSFSGGSFTPGAGAERLISIVSGKNIRFQAVRMLTAAPGAGGVLNEGNCITLKDSTRIEFKGSSLVGQCRGGAGISLDNTSYSNVEQVSVSLNGSDGIFIRNGSAYNYFGEISAAANSRAGVKLTLAGYGNRFEVIHSYSNATHGFNSMGTARVSVTRSYFVGNGTNAGLGHGGLVFVHGHGHRIVSVVSALNQGDGIRFEERSTDVAPELFSSGYAAVGKPTLNTLHNFVAYLNGGAAIRTTSLDGVLMDRHVFSHLVLTGNTSQIDYSGATGGDASTFIGAGFLTGGNVMPTFPSGGSQSQLVGTTQPNLGVNSFVGRITTDDSSSSVDNSGTAASGGLSTAESWMNRATLSRAWQKEWVNASSPTTNDAGLCSSGNCRMIDWALQAADAVLLSRTGTGAGAGSSNASPTANAACPSEVNGTEVIVLAEACTDSTKSSGNCVGGNLVWYDSQVYLKNAVELISADGGDDDGLCESNETCIYTPNFGAYQGHGSLASCTFSGTASSTSVGGVTLKFYGTNGR